MALKQLILSRKLQEKRDSLEALRKKGAELKEKRSAMSTREAELEEAVKEITEETEEAVKAEVEAAVAEFEAEVAQVEADQAENDQAIVDLEKEIGDLQAELDELNKKVEEQEPEQDPAPADDNEAAPEDRAERKVSRMNIRKMFGSYEARAKLFAREDVKQFAARLRQLGKEKRAISGQNLLIPEIMLPMIKEQVEEQSQLLKYVNKIDLTGTGRETVMGTVPEAVWTEMIANLNELSLVFNDVEVDGYKAGGYIPVPNSILEDNDVNLVSVVISALIRAIAIALDKAILYGTGTKMPLGIVTRLAQTAAPENYSATERAWADLHTSNIKVITAANSTGIKLFQELIKNFGNAKKKYGAGGKFWAMNEQTHTAIIAEALNFNSAGAIVAGLDNTMPVIGGDIVELDFIPDNVIVAGYGQLYLMVERAGIAVDYSEHFLFTSDKTVYKATARYDGKPAIAEGFVAIAINGGTVAANAVTFTADTANS